MTIQTTVIPTTIDFQVDYFTAQSTDGSGEVALSLTRTPDNADNIMVYCSADDRFGIISGLVGSTLTVTLYKTAFQKISAITGALSNLPASVTEATAIQNPASSSVGTAVNDGSGQTTSPPHNHNTSIGFLYQHDHPFTESSSALDLAVSEASLGFVVIYKK